MKIQKSSNLTNYFHLKSNYLIQSLNLSHLAIDNFFEQIDVIFAYSLIICKFYMLTFNNANPSNKQKHLTI